MALAVVRRIRMPSHAQPRRETSRRDLLARAPRAADLGDPSLPASGAVTDRSRIVHRGSAGNEACDILSHGETERPFVFADLCRRLALTHSARRRQRPPNSGHRRKVRSIDRLSTAPSWPRSCYRADGRSGVAAGRSVLCGGQRHVDAAPVEATRLFVPPMPGYGSPGRRLGRALDCGVAICPRISEMKGRP